MSRIPIPIALTVAVAAGPAFASSIILAPPLEGTPSIRHVEGFREAAGETAKRPDRRARTPLIMRGGGAPATAPGASAPAAALPPAEAEPLPGTPRPDLE